ncbi:precorrin-6A reductase [Diplocloster agilis]|uniref:Precorrin-6A reductase n=1 Tax=Diplocloster agilis TaxID=2850323 RepID=A0A949JWJ8_9FIRM|nr:precorrin-6A reductase [Diplocloster agilis]MBU9736490.1 precorrin-6A reductase [Diplocloster agilis]
MRRYKVILFGGTSEGRELCGYLKAQGIPSLICVATPYGEEVIREIPGIPEVPGMLDVRTGRLDMEEMRELFLREQPMLVVDATHPYAGAVTQNIRTACMNAGISYRRLLRPAQAEARAAHIIHAADTDRAAQILAGSEGNILVTTGSKELKPLCAIPNYEERLYVRVLPAPEVLEDCHACGIKGRHLIAMQGPFSEELNYALIREFDIRWLLTKESGKPGGFQEKIRAAERAGIRVLLIDRPAQESGYFLEEMKIQIGELVG